VKKNSPRTDVAVGNMMVLASDEPLLSWLRDGGKNDNPGGKQSTRRSTPTERTSTTVAQSENGGRQPKDSKFSA